MSNQLVATTPGELQHFLGKAKSAIAMALPKHLNPDRMMRLAITCFSTTPALRECTAQSILASIVVAGQLGLEPGVNGQGYLIPYKRTCTFVPGWQGLVGLLNNTGRATAWTGAVFKGDIFKFELGSKPVCQHIPGDNYGDSEMLEWVYACGKVNGSEQPVVEAWPISRVWKHRDRFNKVGAKHYSYQHPEMYARKVVLLQVLKYMPRSIELNNAIAAANAAEDGVVVKMEDGVIIDAEVIGGAESAPSAESLAGKPKAEERQEPVTGEGTGEDKPSRAQVTDSTIEQDVKNSLITKFQRRMDEGKIGLKYFMAAVVQLPGVPTTVKLLTDLTPGQLDAVDNDLDAVIDKATEIQTKTIARSQS